MASKSNTPEPTSDDSLLVEEARNWVRVERRSKKTRNRSFTNANFSEENEDVVEGFRKPYRRRPRGQWYPVKKSRSRNKFSKRQPPRNFVRQDASSPAPSSVFSDFSTSDYSPKKVSTNRFYASHRFESSRNSVGSYGDEFRSSSGVSSIPSDLDSLILFTEDNSDDFSESGSFRSFSPAPTYTAVGKKSVATSDNGSSILNFPQLADLPPPDFSFFMNDESQKGQRLMSGLDFNQPLESSAEKSLYGHIDTELKMRFLSTSQKISNLIEHWSDPVDHDFHRRCQANIMETFSSTFDERPIHHFVNINGLVDIDAMYPCTEDTPCIIDRITIDEMNQWRNFKLNTYLEAILNGITTGSISFESLEK